MKKIIVLLSIAAGAGALFSVYKKMSGPKNLSSAIIVGTNPNFPPFEYKENGELKGFEIELMDALAQKMGKKIEFKDLAFDTLLLEIQFGKIDMIASAMTPTPLRAQKVTFTKPYLAQDPLVVITSADHPITTMSDLVGKEVVVNDGYTAESYMMTQKGVELKRLATPAEAFLALNTGRAYAYVSARSAVQPFFDKYGTQKFSLFEIPGVFDSYALAVAKNNPELHASLQSALDAMQADGSLVALKKKWHLVW